MGAENRCVAVGKRSGADPDAGLEPENVCIDVAEQAGHLVGHPGAEAEGIRVALHTRLASDADRIVRVPGAGRAQAVQVNTVHVVVGGHESHLPPHVGLELRHTWGHPGCVFSPLRRGDEAVVNKPVAVLRVAGVAVFVEETRGRRRLSHSWVLPTGGHVDPGMNLQSSGVCRGDGVSQRIPPRIAPAQKGRPGFLRRRVQGVGLRANLQENGVEVVVGQGICDGSDPAHARRGVWIGPLEASDPHGPELGGLCGGAGDQQVQDHHADHMPGRQETGHAGLPDEAESAALSPASGSVMFLPQLGPSYMW